MKSTSTSPKLKTPPLRSFAASLRKQLEQGRQGVAPPSQDEKPSSGDADVSGESGGGPIRKKLFVAGFGNDISDGVPVQAFVYKESMNMCGGKIGTGQFFCTKYRDQCGISSHTKKGARVAKEEWMYLPVGGNAQQAYCQPCVDADRINADIVEALTTNTFPMDRMKVVMSALRDDPFSLAIENVMEHLGAENTFFRNRKRALNLVEAMTPHKAAQAKKAVDDLDELLEKLEDADFSELVVSPGDTVEAEALNAFILRFTDLWVALSDSVAIMHSLSGSIELVSELANSTLLQLEGELGSDPGIGGTDTGLFSSAWEGIEYVHNQNVEQSSILTSSKRDFNGQLRKLKDKVEDVAGNTFVLQQLMHENVVEASGGLADKMELNVKLAVADVLDDFVNQSSEDASSGDELGDVLDASAIRQERGVGGDVAAEIDALAEITALKRELELMRTDVNHLKSVTSSGALRFPKRQIHIESEMELYQMLVEADKKTSLPDCLHVLFADLWAILDEACTKNDADMRQASDVTLAKSQESSIKAKFEDPTELSRYSSFQRGLPLFLEPPKTPISSNIVLVPLPALDTFKKFDNPTDGVQGRKQLIEDDYDSVLSTLDSNMHQELGASRDHDAILLLAVAMKTTLEEQWTKFVAWACACYEKESESSSETEAWALVAGCIRAMFVDIKKARQLGQALRGLTGLMKEARLIWAMGMGTMKLGEFVKHKFNSHPTCVSVYTQYMNRCRTPLSSFKKMEQSLKTINGEVKKLQSSVDKLEKKKN